MPPQRSTSEEAKPPETKAPAAFVIPTAVLVEVIKLVGRAPSHEGASLYLRLQQLQPLAEEPQKAPEPPPDE